MEAALRVFGRTEGTIDDVIREAGVSRGTFYNYFENADSLLRSVAIAAATELMQAVAPVVESNSDPAARVSAGVRSWVSLIQRYPSMAAFLRRAGLYILEAEQVRVDVGRDLVAGMAERRFTITELELGFVLVVGTVLAAINSFALGGAPTNYGNKLAQRILMSLGVDEPEAKLISRRKLGPVSLPAQSLILQSLG